MRIKFDGVFSEINHVIEVFKKKCLALLLYGTEACPMKKYRIASLQFVVNTCFAKKFNKRSKDVINDCQFYFNYDSVFDCVTKTTSKFLCKYAQAENFLCVAICAL